MSTIAAHVSRAAPASTSGGSGMPAHWPAIATIRRRGGPAQA